MSNEPDSSTVSLTIDTLLNERHALNTKTRYPPTAQGRWVGPFKGARRGLGTEFDDLRHYAVGDDTRHIDWKASARTNIIHTKLYREERELQTTLVIDLRDALFTGSTQLQAVRLGRLSARILWHATGSGCKTQLLIVTDAGLGLSENGSGHNAAINACSLLARIFASIQKRLNADTSGSSAASEIQGSSTTTDLLIRLNNKTNDAHPSILCLDQVAEWLLQRTNKLGYVFWLSSFDQCGLDFEDNVSLLSRSCPQIAITVDDVLVTAGLPPGKYNYHTQDAAQKPGSNHSTHQVRTLGRSTSGNLYKILQDAKVKRDHRLTQCMMTLFATTDDDNEVVTSLQHYGCLP